MPVIINEFEVVTEQRPEPEAAPLQPALSAKSEPIDVQGTLEQCAERELRIRAY